MNLTTLTTPALVISISLAIMQMLKYADVNNVFKRFYPLASFVIGILLSLFVFHLVFTMALMTSLAIAGVYDGWTFTIMGKGQDNSTPSTS